MPKLNVDGLKPRDIFSLKYFKLSWVIVFFFSILFIFILFNGYLNFENSKNEIKLLSGNNLIILSETVSEQLENELAYRIESLKNITDRKQIRDFIKISNFEYSKIQNLEEHIFKLDQDWIRTPENQESIHMTEILTNESSYHLNEYLAFLSHEYQTPIFAEIFITNQYGVNIGQTSRTTDFKQSDEIWWQVAKNDGMFVGNVDFDESANVVSIDLGIRIDDADGNFLGVVKGVYTIEHISEMLDDMLKELNELNNYVESISLVDVHGNLIHSSGKNLPDQQHANLIYENMGGPHGYFFNLFDGGIHAYAQSHDAPYWISILNAEPTLITSPIDSSFQSLLINTIILFIFSSLFLLIILLFVLKPFKELIFGFNQLKKHDFNFKLKPKGFSEFNTMVTSFNNTCVELQKYDHKVKASSVKLQKQLSLTTTLQRAIDSSALISITDLQGKIVYTNSKFELLLNYSSEELLGDDYKLINSSFHPDEFFNDLWTTISKGKIWSGDIKNKSKYGRSYWFRTNILPMFNENAIIDRYISIQIDVTEIYESKEKIRQQLVSLEETEISKDEFLSMISHELKSPLFPIIGYCDLLRSSEYSENFNKSHFEALDEITSSAEQLNRITDDLLTVNKIHLKKLIITKIDFSLIAFMTGVLQENTPFMKDKKIKFNVIYLEDRIINSDENRLFQVMSNLIRNAVDFVPDENGEITVNVEFKDNFFLFSVKDNGIGISKDDQTKIFDTFFQANTSATRSHGGTGLGLAICRGIVESLGGVIYMKSELTKGTTFFFTVPNTNS